LLGTTVNNDYIASNASGEIITRGDFTNNGIIDNYRQLTVRGNFVNSLGSTINNLGSAILVNDDEGIFDNYGTIENSNLIQNYGIFNNYGTLINNGILELISGQLINHPGATIQNNAGGIIDKSATFVNEGLIQND